MSGLTPASIRSTSAIAAIAFSIAAKAVSSRSNARASSSNATRAGSASTPAMARVFTPMATSCSRPSRIAPRALPTRPLDSASCVDEASSSATCARSASLAAVTPRIAAATAASGSGASSATRNSARRACSSPGAAATAASKTPAGSARTAFRIRRARARSCSLATASFLHRFFLCLECGLPRRRAAPTFVEARGLGLGIVTSQGVVGKRLRLVLADLVANAELLARLALERLDVLRDRVLLPCAQLQCLIEKLLLRRRVALRLLRPLLTFLRRLVLAPRHVFTLHAAGIGLLAQTIGVVGELRDELHDEPTHLRVRSFDVPGLRAAEPARACALVAFRLLDRPLHLLCALVHRLTGLRHLLALLGEPRHLELGQIAH